MHKLDAQGIQEFRGKYFGIIVDYVIDEVQEEKIKYIVNGFINLASIENPNEDFVLFYYDTLRELRIVDIAILKLYYGISQRHFTDLLEEFKIEYEQYDSIREKLVRLGLLTTKREAKIDDLYNNVINIQEFLESLSKGKNVKLKNFKRIEKKDACQISRFGREFDDFFINSQSE